jgi:UDP:flavonoid glycosyltransferase YjiC (YdhE family)
MRCVLANVGSRGDVEPFVLLARALADRGHDVTLALDDGHHAPPSENSPPNAPRTNAPTTTRGTLTPASLGTLAARDMIDAVARAVSAATADERSEAGYRAFVGHRRDALRARILELAAAHDVVIIGDALAFADAGRLPWTTPTAMIWYTLAPESELRRLLPLDCLHLAALPSLLAPRDPALAARIRHTGFWRAPPRPLAAAVERFISAGAPPLFLTMGSMTGFDAPSLVARFVAAARAHRRRAIVQRGWAALDLDAAEDVLLVDEVDYASLFPRCAALFVHGGTGTIGHALHAGKPIAVLPLVADQLAWANLVAAAGIGLGTLEPRTADFDAAMSRAADATLIAAATRLAARLAADAGLPAACDAVEEFSAGRAPR